MSILAISFGVALILVSVGLTYGQLDDLNVRTSRLGDLIIQPPDASFFLALNGAALNVKIQRVIEQVKGVAAATPILTKFVAEDFQTIYGVDQESFRRVSTRLEFRQGGFFEGPDQISIDTRYAAKQNLGVGDQVVLLDSVFVVQGVFEAGTAAGVLMPLETLQRLNGTPGKATVFFVRVAEGIPIKEVRGNLEERMPHYKMTETAELQAMMMDNTPVFKEFLAVVVLISVVISFLIVLLVMYSSISERTRDIGILKSLGASKFYIIRILLLEAAFVCCLGAVLGFLVALATIQAVQLVYPFLPISLPAYWYGAAFLLALGGGTLGATYPALRAANLDPVRALGYE